MARAGSISAAARRLGWTQPAVSQHLRALEREVGSALVLRGSGGVELTEPGRALLVHADAVAGRLHLADEELAALAQLGQGTVRLAAYPSAAASLVPDVLARLSADHPHLNVTLTEAEPPEAVGLIDAGDIDVALVFDYAAAASQAWPGLRWHPLGQESMQLVLPPCHRLATGPATMAGLAGEAWIVGCARCSEHVRRLCDAAGFSPRVQATSDDYVVVQNLVARGLGVALLPEMAIAAFRHPDVILRAGTTWGRRSYGVVFRDGADHVPATRALLRELAPR